MPVLNADESEGTREEKPIIPINGASESDGGWKSSTERTGRGVHGGDGSENSKTKTMPLRLLLPLRPGTVAGKQQVPI